MKSITLQMLDLVYLDKVQEIKIRNRIKLIYHRMKPIKQIPKFSNVKNLSFVVYVLIHPI